MSTIHIHAYYCNHEWPAVVVNDPVAAKWLAFFAARRTSSSSARDANA